MPHTRVYGSRHPHVVLSAGLNLLKGRNLFTQVALVGHKPTPLAATHPPEISWGDCPRVGGRHSDQSHPRVLYVSLFDTSLL